MFFRLVLFAFSVSLVIGFPNVEDHHADETGILRQESGTGQPESHHDSRKPSSSGSVEPYMDDDGRICQDKIEMVEDIEYENQIHCKVQMQKSCQFINSPATSEDQACHTMYHKECQTVYRPHMATVNVRVCPEGAVDTVFPNETRKVDETDENASGNSVVIDVRPSPPGMVQSSSCVKGRRKVCLTKYETQCSTEMTNHEMTEDHPKCKVEMVPKCNGEGTNCHDVPAMRCRIEQRTVVKTKPETKCHRLPREFCHKEDCKDEEEAGTARSIGGQNSTEEDDDTLFPNCYFRQQIVNEVVPEEKCKYRPERVCHPVLNNNSRMIRAMSANAGSNGSTNPNEPRKRICEMVPKENCENKRMNPKRVLKPMMKKVCRFPRPESSYDRRIMKMIDFSGHP